MTAQADIGLIGLAVMGQNLVLNMADNGYKVAVFNRTTATMEKFAATEEARTKGVVGCATLEDLVKSLKSPRCILIMVKAGGPVDAQIDGLVPLLDKGDIIIDGGNSHYPDTIRRVKELAEKGILFLGAGISGGEEGARFGPSIMPGGPREAYDRVAPIFEAISAKAGEDQSPCCTYIGADGAGHFVKMVHNGIEYADMQMISEVYYLMKNLLGLTYEEMHQVFSDWNEGDLDSYLIEITRDILGWKDDDTGGPLLEVIMDKAGQKGTGRWTSEAALSLGVPAPTIAEAVFARALSALKDERMAAEKILPGPTVSFDGDKAAFIASLREALLASKICAYAQGFQLIEQAKADYGWGDIDMGAVSMIWRGGCIIRAQFLERIKEAYQRDPKLVNLMLDPYFTECVQKGLGAWRTVVGTAIAQGLPVPALASALTYYDSYRTGRLWADMIQAQRDYFGAHTFERLDKPGWHHVDWMPNSIGAKSTLHD